MYLSTPPFWVIALDTCTRMLLLLMLAVTVIHGGSVAPDDADSTCFEEDEYKPPLSNEKVLLDTQNYRARTLVGATGENGTWLSLDYDGVTGAGIQQVSIWTVCSDSNDFNTDF